MDFNTSQKVFEDIMFKANTFTIHVNVDFNTTSQKAFIDIIFKANTFTIYVNVDFNTTSQKAFEGIMFKAFALNMTWNELRLLIQHCVEFSAFIVTDPQRCLLDQETHTCEE